MAETRRKFGIDDHLARHEKALGHLHRLNSFEEAKAYIVKHSLYRPALEFYRYQVSELKEVIRLHAVALESDDQLKEAAICKCSLLGLYYSTLSKIAFDSLGEYARASVLYQRAGLWQESLACAQLEPTTPIQVEDLARSLAGTLAETKDFSAAAIIHRDYLSDIPMAVSLFCKGYNFAEAARLATLYKRPDLLPSTLDVGLIEAMSSMTELIAECKAQINAQVPRVQELRRKKEEDPLAFYDGDGGAENPDIPDDISIAPTDASTTGGTLFTRYTNRSSGTLATNATKRTSRNLRREERKRARGKKGSIFEEEYLVNSIRRLIERVNSVNADVQRLITGLIRRDMSERARAIQNGMIELVDLCQKSIGEIFDTSNQPAIEGTDAGQRTQHSVTESPPVMKPFSRSILLGS